MQHVAIDRTLDPSYLPVVRELPDRPERRSVVREAPEHVPKPNRMSVEAGIRGLQFGQQSRRLHFSEQVEVIVTGGAVGTQGYIHTPVQ